MNGQVVDRLVATYAEAPAGQICALFGSSDHLELAVNGGSAAESARTVAVARPSGSTAAEPPPSFHPSDPR